MTPDRLRIDVLPPRSNESAGDVSSEPPRILALRSRYEMGESITPGEMMTIIHLLPQQRQSFLQNYGSMMQEVWGRHMPGRARFYEPLVENLTSYRQDIVRVLDPQEGDEIVDLGAGLAPLARHFADIAPGVAYWAIDSNPRAKELSTPNLEALVREGRLTKADFLVLDYTRNFPQLPPKGEGQRIAVSSFSLSYQPVDVIIRVIRESFDNNCDSFFITSLDPNFLDANKMLDEMVESGRKRTPEEQERLGDIISMALPGSDGRRFMVDFTQDLIHLAPLRDPKETEFYLRQAGQVTKKSVFGEGTAETVGFLVVPR